jgi:dTDP-4-amino-4,6-dideoxygalactose transaminase
VSGLANMRPIRVPYAAPFIGKQEIDEVTDCLRNGWLTSGPKVELFERQFAQFIGVKHAVAVNSCTIALTIALAALDIGPGDEVIVPTLTFCATAHVVEHRGATPIVVDVGEDFQIDPLAIKRSLSPITRAIIPVHYGGLACDLDSIQQLAEDAGVAVIQDAAHAVGAEYRGRKIGSHGKVTAFSFYASKNMTTGEGGMLTTDDDVLASKVRSLARFGIYKPREAGGVQSWDYEVREAGYKANMTDIQAAIGIQQLRRLDGFISRRKEIAERYSAAFADLQEFLLPHDRPECKHSYHLYAVRITNGSKLNQHSLIEKLEGMGIGTSVHFIPLHRHPFYQAKYSYKPECFPCAEKLYGQIVSLPLYPAMSDEDVLEVIAAVRQVVLDSRS